MYVQFVIKFRIEIAISSVNLSKITEVRFVVAGENLKNAIREMKTLYPNFKTLHSNFEKVTSEL